MKYKVAAIQMSCAFLDKNANLKVAENLIREAAGMGARLVCLPEAFSLGYSNAHMAEMVEAAEPIDGDGVSQMKHLAKELGIYLVAPFIIRTACGICENTAILISDEGQMIGSYSKSHLTPGERGHLQRGTDYPVFDTPLGRIGMIICNDLCYPETARLLGIQNVDLLIVPAAWRYFKEWEHWWKVMLKSRALDNVAMVIAVNRVGDNDGVPLSGESLFVSAEGIILSCADDRNQGVILEEVDLTEIKEMKEKFSFMLAERLPEDYVPLSVRTYE